VLQASSGLFLSPRSEPAGINKEISRSGPGFYSGSRKATTSAWPFCLAKSTGRQPALSLACGSARASTSSRTVSRNPVRAASCSGVAPVLLSATLGSAPCSNNTRTTGELPIIITLMGTGPTIGIKLHSNVRLATQKQPRVTVPNNTETHSRMGPYFTST